MARNTTHKAGSANHSIPLRQSAPVSSPPSEVKGNPNDLIVRDSGNDGQLRHHYNTDDMEHRVPELVEFATTVMTMNSGDLIACGTNHEGIFGAIQDGEVVDIEIQHIGKMTLTVSDSLKRKWERAGFIWVSISTNPDAVKRHRPQ